MSESWRAVYGSESRYEVSDLGSVRSLTCSEGLRKTPRLLHPHKNKNGYLGVTLSQGKEGRASGVKAKFVMVHRLVAEAFLGPRGGRASGWVVNHLDGNKSNNDLANLEWTTVSGNALHAVMLGLAPRGERQGHAKLTVADVVAARLEYRTGGVTMKELAAKFGVTGTTMRIAIRGIGWSFVAGAVEPDHSVCKNGHALAEVGVYEYRGGRSCRQCRRDGKARFMARARAMA